MDPKTVSEWLKGKTPEDFDLIEFGGRVLWPDKLKRLKGDKTYEEVPVCIRVPRFQEELEAYATAQRIAAEHNIDVKRDEDMFKQLHVIARAALAIREPKAPHGQFQPAEVLMSSKDTGIAMTEIALVASKIEIFSRLEDTRLTTIDEETAIKAAFAIVEVRNLSPLAVIAGSALDDCVISMASALVRCLVDRSWQPSRASSTPAP